ncbi:MAG: hypothetical protein H7330_00010 [Hymenobacteraceae bacterium]|nr:hypothetical protein [Hymenobacteraceae bacterium]
MLQRWSIPDYYFGNAPDPKLFTFFFKLSGQQCSNTPSRSTVTVSSAGDVWRTFHTRSPPASVA